MCVRVANVKSSYNQNIKISKRQFSSTDFQSAIECEIIKIKSASGKQTIYGLKMTELDSKSEISLEGDTILSKIGKLTTAHSQRVSLSC